MGTITPENQPNTAQPEDSKSEPAARQTESPRSDVKGRRSVRDYTHADIKPIMLRNRENGLKTTATAIYKYLQRQYGGCFEGQLRTTQRIVRELNAELDKEQAQRSESSDQSSSEIYIPQSYDPGAVAQLDCSNLASLGITIDGRPFQGKVFTFKPMYSKWIYASIVSGETAIEVFETIQDALWSLKGVPQLLRSDNGKALFQRKQIPTESYNDMCHHYGTPCSAINPGRPNENGGAETGNKTVKGLLRDRITTDRTPEFESEHALRDLLREVMDEYNSRIQSALKEERKHLKRLPSRRLEPYDQFERKVTKEGMIRYDGCQYSVPPDLHGSKAAIKIRRYADHLVIYNHDGEPAWRWPLASDATYQVDCRHVIHWLKKKPGAFQKCAYKDQLFPTARFRAAYQNLEQWYALEAVTSIYLAILDMTVGANPIRQNDDHLILEVDCALELLLEGKAKSFTAEDVARLVGTRKSPVAEPPSVCAQGLLTSEQCVDSEREMG